MAHTDVLIVGAGPTGLVLALWLARLGVSVRIIDKTAGPGTTSRAVAVQARTLELYSQLDLAGEVIARGHQTPAINLWTRGRKAAHVPFEDVGLGLTPYPFLHIFAQDDHERLLIERLALFGISVERETQLLDYVDTGDQVRARLRQPDGEQICEARFIAGCDGARSAVREGMGTEFPGGTYQHLFYVADVQASGSSIDGELHVDLDQADFLAIFPLGAGRARLIGTVRDARAAHPDSLTFADVSDRAIKNLKLSISEVNWFSTYRVHHRVAQRFRKGRAFLLGDAAHIHSPVGGQGMNTGIGDAINLAWKLEEVLAGAPDRLLDSYEMERIGFARRLVATTDRAFILATASGRFAGFVRTRLAPMLIALIFRYAAARSYLFRTVGQLTLNYRSSPLSTGKAGEVRAGERLPWVVAGGEDNYAFLAEPVWQVHVYGEVGADLSAWCLAHKLALHGFTWAPAHQQAGLARNGLYLLRPDTYVGLADPAASVVGLAQYCERHGVIIAPAVAPK